MYKALGLGTVKEQKHHYEHVIQGSLPSNKADISPETAAAMKHGIDNEIHAVATIVGKILPVFMPDVDLYESGCRVIYLNNKPFIVVSPDGECRTSMNAPVKCAIEIKCPLPDKKYTTDVHYDIPKYYIPQLLSEMKSLQCNLLLYVSYTPESTTVLEVTFDDKLWQEMWDSLVYTYSYDNPSKPRGKSEASAAINALIDDFRQTNIKLLAQFPSAKAIQCMHCNQDDDNQIVYGQHDTGDRYDNLTTNEAKQFLYKVKTSMTEAHQLLRVPAKEVIVALLTDLDRIKKPDVPHAVPIAYGMSGYSTTTQSVRSILYELVDICKDAGLHVPVLAFDGQFYKLAVRDENDYPLTLLQLMKDTWRKATKMNKISQIDYIISLSASSQNLANWYQS